MDKVYIVAGTKHQYAIFLLMAEVHPDPAVALSDSAQQMDLKQFDEFYEEIKRLKDQATISETDQMEIERLGREFVKMK